MREHTYQDGHIESSLLGEKQIPLPAPPKKEAPGKTTAMDDGRL